MSWQARFRTQTNGSTGEMVLTYPMWAQRLWILFIQKPPFLFPWHFSTFRSSALSHMFTLQPPSPCGSFPQEWICAWLRQSPSVKWSVTSRPDLVWSCMQSGEPSGVREQCWFKVKCVSCVFKLTWVCAAYRAECFCWTLLMLQLQLDHFEFDGCLCVQWFKVSE